MLAIRLALESHLTCVHLLGLIGFSRQPLAEDESDEAEDDEVEEEEEVEDEEADLVDNVDVTEASPPPLKKTTQVGSDAFFLLLTFSQLMVLRLQQGLFKWVIATWALQSAQG